MQIFEVILFFKLRTIQQKTVKPTYLCPLDARKLMPGCLLDARMPGSFVVKLARKSPSGLTITWWGCCAVCFWRNPTELAHSFLLCSCIYFCLYGPFNYISFHRCSRKLSAFSLCSSSLISAYWSFQYVSLYESLLQPWCYPLWLTN